MSFRKLSLVLVLFACAAGFGFRGCSEKQTADFGTGLSIAADSLQTGIGTVHSLRLAGEIEPAKALKLAKEARELNRVLSETVGATIDLKDLDDAGRQNLLDALDKILPRAEALASDGTIQIKNGKVRIVFAIATSGGLVALKQQRGRIAALQGNNLKIAISDETRQSLRETAATLEENERVLAASVSELEKIVGAAN